jgi:hypothetical protein
MKTLWIEKMKKNAWDHRLKTSCGLQSSKIGFSWEWSLPETADEADGSYALSLRRSVYMSFTNRTTGVSRVYQFLERVDAGGEKKLLELLAKASPGQHSRRFSWNPSREES